ncbi:MAG: preprotein translocase subunit SecE [Candidatus Nealsonbacteria bacterium]|nr:preprotein translocase subunit SecE [Candidatus Nealsonbacteria bacterium]
MNIFAIIVNYLKEVRAEVKKVSWPTREQTLNYTLIVVGLSIVVAIYMGGLDVLFSRLLNKLIL